MVHFRKWHVMYFLGVWQFTTPYPRPPQLHCQGCGGLRGLRCPFVGQWTAQKLKKSYLIFTFPLSWRSRAISSLKSACSSLIIDDRLFLDLFDLWILPEETIVPQIAHQLCSLFQARIVCDLKIKEIMVWSLLKILSPTHISLCSSGSLANLLTRAACEAFIGRLTWKWTSLKACNFPPHPPPQIFGWRASSSWWHTPCCCEQCGSRWRTWWPSSRPPCLPSFDCIISC